MKPALLVIDIQKDFFSISPECARSLNDAIENINPVLKFFRSKELPIICIQHMEPDENLLPGQEKFDLPESLEIIPSDIRIHKTYRNSFNKTPLAEILAEKGVDTVFITGFCAEYCVLSTYRGALDLDLTPVLLKNGIASVNQDNLQMVENISNIISYGVLKKMLEQSE